jgi:hypothetical protein
MAMNRVVLLLILLLLLLSAIKIKVRFVKLCASGGESPPGLKAKPLEFRTKEMNGKV